jgi:hypothetical protein
MSARALTATGYTVRNALAVQGVEATPRQVREWAERTGRFELCGEPDNALPHIPAERKIVAFRRLMGRDAAPDIVALWRDRDATRSTEPTP